MDDALGHRPATQPPITVESSLSDIASGTSSNTDTIDELENGEETVLENGDDICSVFDDEMSRNCSVTPGSNTEKTPQHEKKSKRKRSKGSDAVDKMEGLLEKMVTMQDESEKNFMRLEEKMMEMEKERQKENQEFMLRMMAFLCQPPPGSQPPYPTHRYDSMYNTSNSFSQNDY